MQSDSVGVERRRQPFTLIENVILEDQALSSVDILVYLALAKHADGEGTCWPSMSTIARVARVCRSKVFEAIKHLEAGGYLKRTARFRPDGGVTSNVYQLTAIEVRKHPPIHPVDTPYLLERLPPVHPVDTNYIQSEQDSKKRGASARPAEFSRRPASPPSASHPEDQVIHELADVPGLVHDRRFREGVRRLLAEGKTPGEIARAVRSAAEDPQERGGLSFIADRFPRWARKVKERERQECQCLQNESAKSERLERERQLVEERECIRAEQESAAGKHLVAEACARLPWRR